MKNYLSIENCQKGRSGQVLLLGLLLLSCVAGCGSGAEVPDLFSDLRPVTGSVSLKDDPLAGATITFVPQEGEVNLRMASAVTNELGIYELVTPISGMSPSKTKGAVPGKYKVLISRIVKSDGTAVSPEITEADAMAEGAAESLPAKYSNMEKTELTAEVTKSAEGEAVEINFSLK